MLTRVDGTEVKIVAENLNEAWRRPSIDVRVFRRSSPQDPWHLCSDRPAPNWREMSVDEYVKHGRSEKLQTVTHGEILKTASLVGKPMTQFENAAQA